jgi:hypothetical protein
MPLPVFETVSNLHLKLLLAGASKKFEMAYQGTSKAAGSYGNALVGPEAWISKDSAVVLLAFRGKPDSQVALVMRDPAFDPDPIPDYMAHYGDDVLDALEVQRVNFQKIIAGDDWTEDAVVGSGGIAVPSGYQSRFGPSAWSIAGKGAWEDTPAPALIVENGQSVDLAPAGGWETDQRPASMIIHYTRLDTEAGSDQFKVYVGGTEYINAQNGVPVSIDWTNLNDSDIAYLDIDIGTAIVWDIQFSDEQYDVADGAIGSNMS